MTIQQGIIGTQSLPIVAQHGQATTTTVMAFMFRTPDYPVTLKSFSMRAANINSASVQTCQLHAKDGAGKPGVVVGPASDPLNVSVSDSVQTWEWTAGPVLAPSTDYWMVVTPQSSAVSINWKSVDDQAGFQSGRAASASAIANNLPFTRDWWAGVGFEYDDEPTDEILESGYRGQVLHARKFGTVHDYIPVHDENTTQIDTLLCIQQIAIPSAKLQPGDLVLIFSRGGLTHVELQSDGNIGSAVRARIEPTPWNDWGNNVDPDPVRRDDYYVDGYVGFKWNENATPDVHHSQWNTFDTWVVTEDVAAHPFWYVKLCARASNQNAVPGDVLKIDRAQIEFMVLR